jgi:hypothetical protein
MRSKMAAKANSVYAAAAGIALLLACAAPLPSAAETVVPPMKQGLWEYQRSIQGAAKEVPAESKYRRCTNPSRDFERQGSMLAQAGCTFHFATTAADTIDRVATCLTSDGSMMRNRTWLHVADGGEFSARIESGGMLGDSSAKSVEELKGKRIGDCERDS